MNDNNLTISDLARWLEPACIELDQARLADLAAVVDELRDGLNGRELDAVRAAHGQLSDGARTWAAVTLGERAPTVNPRDATDLLERLLAAAVVTNLHGSDSGVRCALGAASAEFLRLTPRIDDIPARAAQALASAGRSARERTEIGDITAHAKSLKSLSDALRTAFGVLCKRQDALDEEVEMLWWALRATEDESARFSEPELAVRAVNAAGGLADRTKVLPGPPSAHFLLSRVLRDCVNAEVTLAELAGAVSKHLRPLGVSPDPLLPLASAAAEQARQGAETSDDTWQTVVARTLKVDLSTTTTLVAGAQQVYRELLLQRLLATDG